MNNKEAQKAFLRFEARRDGTPNIKKGHLFALWTFLLNLEDFGNVYFYITSKP